MRERGRRARRPRSTDPKSTGHRRNPGLNPGTTFAMVFSLNGRGIETAIRLTVAGTAARDKFPKEVACASSTRLLLRH